MRRSAAVELPRPGEWKHLMAVRDLEDARDRDLLRKVRGGDEEAFRALFRRYGPLAKGLAHRVVRQAFIAEEIVQESFLALWRDPHGYREERGTFRSWILSTVHHRAVDAVRREEAQRRRREELAPESGVQEDIALAVVDDAELAQRRSRVRAVLQDIPPEQRQVLEMMYFDGQTQSAIAATLGIPLGTVKSRTLLGMRRLRTMLVEPSP